MTKRKFYFTIGSLVAILVVGAYISIHIGTLKIPLNAVFYNFDCAKTGLSPEQAKSFKAVIEQIRFPRVLVALLCGMALSISGSAFQSMFRNPLVSPDLLGVLAGSAFGASLGMVVHNSFLSAQVGAFIFGVLAVVLAVMLARLFPGNRLIRLIMGGVISTSFFTSLVSVIKYMADSQNKLPGIVYWLMGGFSSVTRDSMYICGPTIFIGSVALICMSNYMNILSMGDEEAQTLGVNVDFIRKIVLCITTVICAVTVSVGGMIGWVGLMIPHIARMVTGPDNRQLMPISALIGAIYLMLVDDFCRCAFASEMPIGIITSLLGVPFFIFVNWRTSIQ